MPTHFPSALPLLHTLVLAATKKTTGSPFGLVFILIIFGVVAYLFIRPQRRRQREMASQQRSIQVGDEVVTAAGIVGRVKSMTDERVVIEVAPGSTMEIVRRAIGQRVWQPETPPPWGGPTGGQWNFPASSDDPDKHEPPPDGTGGPA
ncbi:MAG: preprotein translocase subunit YajC [Acidimicrobiales bacterium]|jgi:preprotein translocase subunit YajC